MQIKFVPTLCTDHEVEENGQKSLVKATFMGHLVLKGNTYDERMELLESMGLTANAQGEVSGAQIPIVSQLRKLVKKSQEHYVSVDLERISDGKKFTSFEEMSTDGECDPIITEVGYALRSGFKPGKN